MKTLTVFTPTYNRAHTLGRTYESLCAQTNFDFEWLVIDDGSTDGTRKLVESWKKEERIPIRYIYKENGGLFTGYNTALANIDTELNICIDSDDYMPPNAVEIILDIWKNRLNTNVAGIVGLDYYNGGDAIGGLFPQEAKQGHFTELSMKYHHEGDTKIVCRTDLMKPFVPMSSFGEKNFNPIYLYLQVDNDNEFIFANENFCFVDYQPTGMAANIYKQFKNSPRSFAALRELNMSQQRFPLTFRFRNAIHYVSSCLFLNDWNLLFRTQHKILVIVAIPFGFLLNLYIRYKAR